MPTIPHTIIPLPHPLTRKDIAMKFIVSTTAGIVGTFDSASAAASFVRHSCGYLHLRSGSELMEMVEMSERGGNYPYMPTKNITIQWEPAQ